MAHRIVNNAKDLADLTVLLDGLGYPLTIEWVKGRDRSADQNRTMWLWAAEAGHQLGETPDEVQRRWKLHHGVPILREDSSEFRSIYDEVLKTLPYQKKLELMRFIPVTSEMKVRQMVRFMDAIWKECAQMRIHLTDPERETQRRAA